MPVIQAQVGVGEESTYGTYAVPTAFPMFLSEGLTRSAERDESEAIRPGAFVLGADDWEEGRVGCEGPVELEWADRGMRLWAKHMLGKVTTTQPDAAGNPTVYRHVAEIESLDGKSLTVQVGRPRGATVRPWTYLGCKVTEWELTNEVGGFLTATFSFDAREETRTPALAANSLIAGQRKLHWAGASILVNGVEVPLSDVSLSGTNPLRTDRYFMRATSPRLKDEPLEDGGRREFTGSLSGEYRPEFEALYDMVISGEQVPLVAKWTGRTITGTYKFDMQIDLPSIRIDGGPPNVSGAEAITQGVDFAVTQPATGSAVKFTITDNRAT